MSKRPVVLIVEDEPTLARATPRVLSAYGWDTIVVSSAAEAEAAQDRADVILTDWSVGGWDVIETALRPVVIYSGHDLDEAAVGARVVRKPAPANRIHAALVAALEEPLC